MGETSTDDLLASSARSHDRLAAAFDELGRRVRPASRTTTTGRSPRSPPTSAPAPRSSGTTWRPASQGEPAPGAEINQPIWDEWNAKSPTDQIRDSLVTNAAFLDAVDALTDDQRAAWQLELFGMQQDLPTFLRMRLSEHALHTWDVTVVARPVLHRAGRRRRAGRRQHRDGRRLGRQALRRAGVRRGPDDVARTGLPPRPRSLGGLPVAFAGRHLCRLPCRCRRRPSCAWSTAASTPTTLRPRPRSAESTSTCCGGPSRASDAGLSTNRSHPAAPGARRRGRRSSRRRGAPRRCRPGACA